MSNIMLFPYNTDTKVLLQHQEMIRSHNIVAVSSFKEDERCLLECAKNYNITATSDFRTAMGLAEAVFLIESPVKRTLNDYVKLIELANEIHKPIYCTSVLFKSLTSFDNLTLSVTKLAMDYHFTKSYMKNTLSLIRIPVIAVASEGEDCNKFEVQLLFQEYLQRKGYRASFISSNEYGALYGMHTIPKQLFDSRMSFEEKVYYFNNFAHDICALEQPDMLVMGVPGGLSMLGPDEPNHFSEIPLIMTSAVNADAGIVNLFFDLDLSSSQINFYKQYCLYKYDIPVTCLAMGKQRVLYNMEKEYFNVYHLPDNILCSQAAKQYCKQNNLFNIADRDASEIAFDFVIDQLQGNPSVVV